jgi:hypothetical protein
MVPVLTPFLAIFNLSSGEKCSVMTMKIGVIPNGLTTVKSVVKHRIRN